MRIRKMIYAIVSLLLCLVLLVSVSFAWLSMSTAPEIMGIDTQIGANGSLEIALLSDTTYINPSLIKAGIGDSVSVRGTTVSNLTWGNVVDLSDESYGLAKAVLLPSRLNVIPGERGGGVVSSNMLSVAGYSRDGRVGFMESNTVSATYHDTKFTYYATNQNYGVRAIGSVSNVTSQQAALTNARTAVRSYASAAKSAGESIWSANGPALLELLRRRYADGSDAFTNADVAAIRDTATRTTGLLSYVDSALRQGIVGYGATVIADADTFRLLRNAVENSAMPLSVILGTVSVDLPQGFSTWIAEVEDGKKVMRQVVAGCDALTDGSHTWDELSPLLYALIDIDQVYLNDHLLTDTQAYANFTMDNELTPLSGAGWLAGVADYAGNFDTFFTCTDNQSVEVVTFSSVTTPYLLQIADILDGREAAAGNGTVTTAELKDIYGFAMDLAFRCNAMSDLLLQTEAADRISNEDVLSATRGSGSFMKFTSEQLNTDQILMMMDAIRIGFLDNQNHILGIAKLNTSNYTEEEKEISAPLYLYEHTVSSDGSISIGERRDQNNVIVSLPQNTAAVITVVVWLDGDHVDNSSAAISAKSMTGMLNLQFASSTELVPSPITVQ